jgi:hypothetical protein
MVRGCQKKIIYLKSTGSKVFDEAYFVVSDKSPSDNLAERDMVQEANRILDECVFTTESGSKFKTVKKFVKVNGIPFITGIILGIIIVLLIK